MSDLDRALEALSALHPKKIDLGLERIERVLAALGNPQDKLPPTVHIAGTNGKGSTIAFLRAMAQAQGLSAHVYTSPHLVHFRERIVLGSKEIEDDVLIDVLERVRRANDNEPLSFFEATTAAAFLAFSEHPADICLIEVGLGGRYDATNVIDAPAAVGITPIDYDHAEFLGRDLAKIAREKAGIFKWHAPILIGGQSDLVRAVLEAEANKFSAQPRYYGQDFRAFTERGRLVFEDENQVMDLPMPALKGNHQTVNAGLAIALAKQMQLGPEAIAKGLETVRWPARMQKITSGSLADKVTLAGGELWLDGGHNPQAGRALAAAIAAQEARAPRPLILVMAMLASKDTGGFLDSFKGLASGIITTHIPDHISLAPETLLELAGARGIKGHTADDLSSAIDAALLLGKTQFKDEHDNPPRILICGSLYFAGEVLKLSQPGI
jgi:dihydrofolate synthase/folylpolyglutamate synthase